ncbi:MAG: hypothetical protein J0M29_10925 [Chitinophagales bacterium]|nr:hypothetical protein [Chitinophagales bacterium]
MEIKKSPDDGTAVTQIPNGKSWFESNFKKDDQKLEPFISFNIDDVKKLISEQSSSKIVLSKQSLAPQITLALAGISKGGVLQVKTYGTNNEKEHQVLLGADFSSISGANNIDLNFQTLMGHNPPEVTYKTSYIGNGPFDAVISKFQKRTERSNGFATINFRVDDILNILNANVAKLTFVKGYYSIIQQSKPDSNDSFQLKINLYADLEALIAVGVDTNNQVVTDIVMPESTWPIRWQRYN